MKEVVIVACFAVLLAGNASAAELPKRWIGGQGYSNVPHRIFNGTAYSAYRGPRVVPNATVPQRLFFGLLPANRVNSRMY